MFRNTNSISVAKRRRENFKQSRGEDGYVLVALLALMSILALTMISVAPSVRQQSQRERELEAIARGEEVAEAIRLFILEKRTLPTSIDQLLEGLPRGTKKRQILRPNAAIDPLTESGEWKLMRPKGPEMIEFQRQVMLYNNGGMPKTRDEARVTNVYTAVLVQINNLGDIKSEDEAPGDEDDSENPTGPFIGVASRSRRDSVITYYGIERHDEWVFTPLFRQ